MFNKFYKGRKVFVTGHTGFKGSWLSLFLLYLGAEVKGYALPPYNKRDHFHAISLDRHMNSVIGDIRDTEKLQKEIASFKPEVIFHLAAQPLVRESYLTPVETFDINVMGTIHLLNLVRFCDSVTSFVNVTSDKCYENSGKQEGYREDEPMGGHDPYSASKGCSELVTRAYRRSFLNQDHLKRAILVATARAGNVIGGGDWCKDRIMTDAIEALQGNRPIQVRNPEAVRPWQHVLEPLSGYLLLASQIQRENVVEVADGWNFGPNLEKLVSVKDLVEMIIEVWGSGDWKDVSSPEDLHEARYLHLDCEKAKNQLNWSPVLSVEQSVKFTVEWYKHAFHHTEGLYDFSSNQLGRYLSIAKDSSASWVN